MLRTAVLSFSLIPCLMFSSIALADGSTVSATPVLNPQVLALPNGFSPDGIAISRDGTIYMASIFNGMIVHGDINGSEIKDVLVEGQESRPGWGMDLNSAETHLVVAGGFAGTARVYDAKTGVLVSEVKIADGGIVNDVIVADDIAYFTNSALPELYEVPLALDGTISSSRTIPLSGDFQFDAKNFANANGIVSKSESTVIVNHSFLGKFYSVDITTGVANEVDLGGETVSSDGIALDGTTLVGSEPPENQIAVLELGPDGLRADVVARYTSDLFDFPTLVALENNDIYVVNGKLSTDRADDVPYEVLRFTPTQ